MPNRQVTRPRKSAERFSLKTSFEDGRPRRAARSRIALAIGRCRPPAMQSPRHNRVVRRRAGSRPPSPLALSVTPTERDIDPGVEPLGTLGRDHETSSEPGRKTASKPRDDFWDFFLESRPVPSEDAILTSQVRVALGCQTRSSQSTAMDPRAPAFRDDGGPLRSHIETSRPADRSRLGGSPDIQSQRHPEPAPCPRTAGPPAERHVDPSTRPGRRTPGGGSGRASRPWRAGPSWLNRSAWPA